MTRLRLQRFRFSTRQPSPTTNTGAQELAGYQDYLRQTLPPGWTAEAKHIKAICEHLDAVQTGEIDRLAIHMPPRHGKTETGTVRYGAYCMEMDPHSNSLVTAYNTSMARRFSRKTRAIVRARTPLSKDNAAQDEWSMPEGGTFMARGVGSPPTGVGFRRIIIDDPIRRREDAESEVYREKAWDWYTDDLYTRVEPGGAIVMICTRWHHDDIAARAVASERGRWTVLNLAAICEDETDAIGRVMGDALWPERYTVADLDRIRDVIKQDGGEYGWSSLYQQNPTPRTGAYIRTDRIEVVTERPQLKSMCRAWDLASTAGGGDFTVGVLMGIDGDGYVWVLDAVMGQYDPDERDRIIRQTAVLDGVRVRVRLPQDPGQAGKSQRMHLMRLLQGYSVAIQPVTGDKTVRAEPFASAVAGGMVKMTRGEWTPGIMEQWRQFPVGKHDDAVDAAADAYNELTLRSKSWGAV